MVDRVAPSPSLIPVPKSKSPQNVHYGDYVTEIVSVPPPSTAKESGDETESQENGIHREKPSKLKAPNMLLVGKNAGNAKEKGFETFLMTGDMIIKTNQRGRQDGSGLERHHSDSATSEVDKEKVTFKRSASSPDQSDFTGAIFQTDGLVMDKSLETTINRKPSAESGFEDQAFSSDAGMSEKQKQIPLDPNSVSDLSEIESDEIFTNMTSSQYSSVSGNLSPLSTPSDMRSDISVNTVLLQEVEPLLNDGDSSSSIDISSVDSSSGEIPADIVFERSMSDSGGMSPLNPEDVNKLLSASKSAEKITFQKQSKQSKQESTKVRASKSHENYFGTDLTFINIDLDDTAYSLDQIPQPTDTSTAVNIESQSTPVSQKDNVRESVSVKSENGADDRVFMPSFINIEDHEPHESRNDSEVNSVTLNEQNVSPLSNSPASQNGSRDPGDSTKLSRTHVINTSNIEDNSNHILQGDNSDMVDDVIDNSQNSDLILDGLFCQPPTKHIDLPSAQRLAKRLYNLDGFRKSDVSRHLSKKNDFSTLVAEEYLKFFDFTGLTLDGALRRFLKQFSLIGETQERERVLAHFSQHYMKSNPGSYHSEDACHTLVCAIMILNTDLHNQNVGRKMTSTEFVENLAELNDGENFPKEILKALYQAIKSEQIEWLPDDDSQEPDHRPDDQRVPPIAVPNLPQFVGKNPFLDVPDPSQTTEYKKGYMMRKCCVEADGRRTPLGKRSWKMFYVVLRDMILYLHKDTTHEEDSFNAIRIHHCLASKATDYVKKQHVFRLHTADWAEYLFQSSNSKELQDWIDTVNFVAATLSAPPLPGAVGSQKKFQRPLLPVSYTRYNLPDQLHSLEERLKETELDLQDHRTYPPERGAKQSSIQHYLEKEKYLVYEISRLKTYTYLLKSKLNTHSDPEPSLAETTIGENDEGFHRVTSPVGKKLAMERSLADRNPSNPDATGTNLANPGDSESPENTDNSESPVNRETPANEENPDKLGEPVDVENGASISETATKEDGELVNPESEVTHL